MSGDCSLEITGTTELFSKDDFQCCVSFSAYVYVYGYPIHTLPLYGAYVRQRIGKNTSAALTAKYLHNKEDWY